MTVIRRERHSFAVSPVALPEVTLFDFTDETVTPPGPLRFRGEPSARVSDPVTSHLAAEAVAPGCKECIDATRRVLLDQTWNYRRKPITAFQIAELVERAHPRRWAEDTIRRRVKDADLMFVDKLGISPRGRACERWTL